MVITEEGKLMIVILIRHGQAYDSLTRMGESQMQSLADRLAAILEGKRRKILSSPAVRALESANIISRRLCVIYTEHPELGNEQGQAPMPEQLFRIIQENSTNCEVLVIVSHKGLSEWYPTWYRSSQMGMNEYGPLPSVPQGQAVLLDTETGEYQII